jgi:DNA-binding NarL/FixJ family response regulator
VLLADDDAGVSRAISRLLAPWCEMVGCAPDSPALFDAVLALEPEVVLLDFSLPGGLTGIEVCRRLKTTAPEVRVVALTASDDPELPQAAREAGASAFVWKLHAADHLWPTIEAVLASRR